MRYATIANTPVGEMKKIPELDEYSATPDGRIYSNKRGRFLTKQIDGKGYETVMLVIRGECKRRRVHRLVAITYLGKPTKNGMTVNHKNEIKTDNRVENLEWIELADNLRYGTRGEKVGKARSITVYYVDSSGHKTIYPSMSAAARSVNVTVDTLRHAAMRNRWTYSAGGYIWRISK